MTDHAHRLAKWRTRRIIMNNDGDDGRVRVPRSCQEFLDRRTRALADSRVDSVFYFATAHTWYEHPDQNPRDFDPLEEIARWCGSHGREIFYSLRMNDQHDAAPGMLSPWKQDHREWLMNIQDGYPKWSYSMLDYGVMNVREKVFQALESIVNGHDVDGIELDFCRHFCLFRSQMQGQPVLQAECDLMTDLLRRIRNMTQAAARRRDKPMLLAARLFDDADYCRWGGIDLRRWLEEGLVDMLISGDYFKLRPWTDWAALGRQYDVPVYACLEPRRFPPPALKGQQVIDGGADLPQWRGEALGAWKAGVNGIYTFNRFDPNDPVFRELHDPEYIETLDHVTMETFAGAEGSHYHDPGFWIKGGRRFLRGPGGRHADDAAACRTPRD